MSTFCKPCEETLTLHNVQELQGTTIHLECHEKATGIPALGMVIQSGLFACSSSESEEVELDLSDRTDGAVSGSRTVADDAVRFAHLRILDNASGVGTTSSIISQCMDAGCFKRSDNQIKSIKIIAAESAVDFSNLTSNKLYQKAKRKGWTHIELKDFGMASMPYGRPYFTHVFTNLSILFSNDDDAAVQEVYRVLKPGGLASFTSWKSFWKPVDSNDAAGTLPGFGEPIKLFPSAGWRDPAYIESKLASHGFEDIVIISHPFKVAYDQQYLHTVVSGLVRAAMKKLWATENDELYSDDFKAMVDAVTEQYVSTEFDSNVEAWIVTARKPINVPDHHRTIPMYSPFSATSSSVGNGPGPGNVGSFGGRSTTSDSRRSSLAGGLRSWSSTSSTSAGPFRSPSGSGIYSPHLGSSQAAASESGSASPIPGPGAVSPRSPSSPLMRGSALNYSPSLYDSSDYGDGEGISNASSSKRTSPLNSLDSRVSSSYGK